MLKKILLTSLVGTFALTSVVLGAPSFRQEATIIPITDSAYDLGSSLKRWANIYADNADITSLTAGTLTISSLVSGDMNVLGCGYFGTTSTSTVCGNGSNSYFVGNVGIGTTNPSSFKLEVAGNIGPEADNTRDLGSGARRFANLYATNINATGATLSGFTQGSVVFAGASGVLSQDNTNFFWNNTDKRLGIGTASPAVKLHSLSTSSGVSLFRAEATSVPIIELKRSNNVVGNGQIRWIGSDNSIAWSLLANEDVGGNNFNIMQGATSRLYIKAGNVGIGTTAPVSPLTINGSATTATTIGAKENRIFLLNNSVTTNNGAEIVIGTTDTTTGRYAAIGTSIQSNASGQATGDVYIATKTNTSDTSLTPRIYVKGNGNVGIGTTTPVQGLEIANSDFGVGTGGLRITGARPGIRIQETDGNANENWQIENKTGVFSIGTNNDAFSSVSDKFFIKQDGNVGIGTTNPETLLDVVGGDIKFGERAGGSQANNLRFNRLASTDSLNIRFQEADVDKYVVGLRGGSNDLSFSTAGTLATTQMLIQASTGNVGIGTTNPGALLDIDGQFKINNDGQAFWGGTTGEIGFLSWDAGLAMVGGQTSQALALYANGERVRITTSGNVGIGTVSPGAKLDVVYSIDTSSDWWTNGKAGIKISNGGGDAVLKFENTQGRIVYGGGGATDRLIFSSRESVGSTAEQVVFDNNGNVGIGTTTPIGKLHVTSGASATTTVSFASIGLTTSKTCFNVNQADGSAASFYFVGGAMVIETNYCK